MPYNINGLKVTWPVPELPPGILKDYTATFYDTTGANVGTCSTDHNATAQFFDCTVDNLLYDEPYECTVQANIEPNSANQGGGLGPASLRAIGRTEPKSEVSFIITISFPCA